MKNLKRIIAGILSVSVVWSTMQVEVSAEAYTDGGKKYSVQQILSDFQYFTKGALTTNKHCVGAVAVGGVGTLDSFGDGSIAPSYIEHIKSVGDYNGVKDGHYLKDFPQYQHLTGMKVYYNTKEEGLNLKKEYEVNEGFIDFANAFQSIEKQSAARTESSDLTLTEEDLIPCVFDGNQVSVLSIPFSKSVHNVVIPDEIYKKCDEILIRGIELNDIIDTQYTISFSDSAKVNIGCSYRDTVVEKTLGAESDPKAIFMETKEANSSKFTVVGTNESIPVNLMDDAHGLKKLGEEAEGNIRNGQMFLSGMKLIWNIPCATEVNADYLPGHLVAPRANVHIVGGNFEGGVIASVAMVDGSEAHFFPYTEVGGAVEERPEPVITSMVPTATVPSEEPVTTTDSSVVVPSKVPVVSNVPEVSVKPSQDVINPSPVTSEVPPTKTAESKPTDIEVSNAPMEEESQVPVSSTIVPENSPQVVESEKPLVSEPVHSEDVIRPTQEVTEPEKTELDKDIVEDNVTDGLKDKQNANSDPQVSDRITVDKINLPKKEQSSNEAPKTGEDSSYPLLFVISIVSGAALIISRKKKIF